MMETQTENGFLSDFEIVPFGPDHCHMAAEIEKLCFTDPWSEESLAYMCPSAVTAGFACIERSSGRLAAYTGIEYVLDEGDIMNVATHPDFRRRGCASHLLRKLFEFADENGIKRLVLEVRASNTAAQKLYESLGFACAGIMPGYYSNPKENAIVMALERKN